MHGDIVLAYVLGLELRLFLEECNSSGAKFKEASQHKHKKSSVNYWCPRVDYWSPRVYH